MSDPFSDQMATDHRNDYAAKDLLDAARRAVDMVLTDVHAKRRLSPKDEHALLDARSVLVKASNYIVEVWD